MASCRKQGKQHDVDYRRAQDRPAEPDVITEREGAATMNLFKAIGRAFSAVGKGILAALRFAESRGLTDEVFDLAVLAVTRAQMNFPDNTARFDYAVRQLTSKGIPESVARLTIELAVQKLKGPATAP